MLSDFLDSILESITDSVEWIGDLAEAVFESAWEMLTDLVCWVVEQFLDLAVAAVNGVDVSGIATNVNAWGSIPANVLEVCSALGLGTAFSIITAAIMIRLVLQLIPFTRLGS